MLHTKSLRLPVSEKKNFEVCCLCFYVPTCDLRGGASFDPQWHHMNKLGRGPLGDATYKISKLLDFPLSETKKKIEIVFFVLVVKLVTSRTGPVLTLGVSFEKTW